MVDTISPDFLLPRYVDQVRGLGAGPPSFALLSERFTLHTEGPLRVVFAPFDWVNVDARVVIVGITPGLYQAQVAFESARAALLRGESAEMAGATAKAHASFSGPMRSNLVGMLDALGLATALGLRSTAELWSSARHLLHSTSAVRYPAFVNGENYTGHTPKLLRSPLLRSYVDRLLSAELAAVPEALVVPCGAAVSEALAHLIAGGKLESRRVLTGLPHPSGGNGHRVRQFSEQRRGLLATVGTWFKTT